MAFAAPREINLTLLVLSPTFLGKARVAHFRTPGTISCVQGRDFQCTRIAPTVVSWMEEEQLLGRGAGAGEIPCKPYKVPHNQNQETVTNRRSEKEAEDLAPGAAAVMEDCRER